MVEDLDDFDSSLTKASEGAQEEKAPVKSKAPAVRSFNTGAPRATRGSDREYSQQMRLIRTYKMDDLENLPPVEIDEDGYPFKPPPVPAKRKKDLTEAQRKVRFVMMWNYTAGNVTISCQDAGIKRKVYAEWRAKDPIFCDKLKEAQLEIGDRAQFRLVQRIGLVPMKRPIAVHDAALFGYVKRFCPEVMEGPSGVLDMEAVDGYGQAASQPAPNIPRPSR